MTANPYESPRCEAEPISAEPEQRQQARRSFRATALILLLPAIYNYWAFDVCSVSRPAEGDLVLYRVVDVLAFTIGFVLIWCFGLPTLEVSAEFLRSVFASRTDPLPWQAALYRSLARTPYLAVAGAALWGLWVYGFYQLRVNFFIISWAVGIPAHMLGAAWYVPLIYRWYRLAVGEAAQRMP